MSLGFNLRPSEGIDTDSDSDSEEQAPTVALGNAQIINPCFFGKESGLEKMLFQSRRGGLSVGQPVGAWPTDGCPVGPGPRVNISIFNHSASRSPSAPARSSSKSRWSASDRWKTCRPQTWRGKNSPSECGGSGHFHISIWKGGFWWCGRGLIHNNCSDRLHE